MAKMEASKAAGIVSASIGVPALVAWTVDDQEGGVFVEVGYAGMPTEDAEYVVGTLLRDIRQQMQANPHPCDACRSRLSRINDALAALERDGARPTGLKRGETH